MIIFISDNPLSISKIVSRIGNRLRKGAPCSETARIRPFSVGVDTTGEREDR